MADYGFGKLNLDSGLKTQTEWRISDLPVAYPKAVEEMEQRAAAIADGRAGELVWLLEHPPIYTAGTSANDRDLIEARFPVYRTGRGGQFTYHGPGQLIGYPILDLRSFTVNDRRVGAVDYVRLLEESLIRADLGVPMSQNTRHSAIWPVANFARNFMNQA